MAAPRDEGGLLIVGAGQLGSALARLVRQDAVWSSLPLHWLDHSALDLTDAQAVEARLQALRPAAVINTAAYNLVDEAERRPDLAFAVNAAGPAYLARAAAAIGARLVHVSTDYVFGDTAPETARPYREDDLPAPRSVYGASKLAGEHLALSYAPDALVVRTSGVYGLRPAGTGKRSFVDAIVQQAQAGSAGASSGGSEPVLRVVSDQRVCPTYAVDLAAMLLALLRLQATGLLHVTNSGSCSWFEFAQAILELAGLRGTVLPISGSERPQAARRPHYSVLDLGRLQGFGITPPSWRDALRRYLAERAAAPGSGQ